ncbi:MAG: DEAD/DEAH box helicase [Anaerolineae bacterium]|nr:DEAD/DEAH box helicase [Anaerolineae bacterium]
MKFTDYSLDDRLLAGVVDAGFEEPTPIQVAALPAALAGKDLVGIAQTGTGKTAVFVLPILQHLLDGPRRTPRALIVTPTRELAQQIHQTIRDLGRRTPLRSVTIYGGIKPHQQMEELKKGVDILVACPGRLLDFVNQGVLSLNSIEMLVLDEADRMLDMGFLPDVKRIIKLVPARRQTMLFTATFPKEIEQMAYSTLKNPQRIDVGFSKPAETVSHALYPIAPHLKGALLIELLKRTDTDSVLVFTRTRRRTYALQKRLAKAGFRVTSLHGDRSQNQRDAALEGFKGGRYQVMIATDVAARGLDINSISHVINYDIPDTPDAYVHRIGRTGRAERSGDAFTFVTPEDDDMVRRIEKATSQRIERLYVEGFDYDAQPAEHTTISLPRGGGRSEGSTLKNRSRRSNAPQRPVAEAQPTGHRGAKPFRRPDSVGEVQSGPANPKPHGGHGTGKPALPRRQPSQRNRG